jgi:hypothetical protein
MFGSAKQNAGAVPAMLLAREDLEIEL